MTTQLSTFEPLPTAWIEKLFDRMAALYGSKFADMWRGADPAEVKKLWADELGKLTREEVTKGAQALMTLEWPPSLPQFINLCRPKLDAQKAFTEAINGLLARDRGEVGTWSHPAIFWAAVRVGAFDLKNSTYPQIKGRWEGALGDELEKSQWQEIPKPVVALPVAKVSKEVAEKYVAKLQALNVESSQIDHKRWAKRIMERHQRGDKTLLPVQVSMAKAALNASEAL
jgi:hypothetical protein